MQSASRVQVLLSFGWGIWIPLSRFLKDFQLVHRLSQNFLCLSLITDRKFLRHIVHSYWRVFWSVLHSSSFDHDKILDILIEVFLPRFIFGRTPYFFSFFYPVLLLFSVIFVPKETLRPFCRISTILLCCHFFSKSCFFLFHISFCLFFAALLSTLIPIFFSLILLNSKLQDRQCSH